MTHFTPSTPTFHKTLLTPHHSLLTFHFSEDEDDEDDEDYEEASPEELEAMAREMFDELKNPKTDKVTVKKLKNWDGIKEVMDSGDLSKVCGWMARG